MKPAALSYTRATTLAEAMRSLTTKTDCMVIAGGQSLGPMLNLRVAQPKHLVDVSRLANLRDAKIEGLVLAVGSCVTHAEIEDGKIPDVTLGLMPHVSRGIAYRAIRNRGTIGGSLAHADPAADWLTTAIAVDASLRVCVLDSTREIKVADFIKGAMETDIREGELISHVLIPRFSVSAKWGHAKYAKKLGDFAESMSVAVVDPERSFVRVVLGRRSEPPALLRRVSALLASSDQDSGWQAIRPRVEADLNELGIASSDYTMHRAIIERAIRDLRT